LPRSYLTRNDSANEVDTYRNKTLKSELYPTVITTVLLVFFVCEALALTAQPYLSRLQFLQQ
jgi:hypothetical protein